MGAAKASPRGQHNDPLAHHHQGIPTSDAHTDAGNPSSAADIQLESTEDALRSSRAGGQPWHRRSRLKNFSMVMDAYDNPFEDNPFVVANDGDSTDRHESLLEDKENLTSNAAGLGGSKGVVFPAPSGKSKDADKIAKGKGGKRGRPAGGAKRTLEVGGASATGPAVPKAAESVDVFSQHLSMKLREQRATKRRYVNL